MASKRSSKGSGRRVTIPLTVSGHDCGSITIDRTALQQGITGEFTGLFSASMDLARAYSIDDTGQPAGLLYARAVGAYVSRRVEQVCKGIIYATIMEWIATQKSDEELLAQLETEGHESLVPQVLIDRAMKAGSTTDRILLAKALAKSLGFVGKRGPKPYNPLRGAVLICNNLARIESAVKAAMRREPDSDDYAPLIRLIKELIPSARAMSLAAEIHVCRRKHKAVELFVSRCLGIGPDQARQVTALVKSSSKSARKMSSN